VSGADHPMCPDCCMPLATVRAHNLGTEGAYVEMRCTGCQKKFNVSDDGSITKAISEARR